MTIQTIIPHKSIIPVLEIEDMESAIPLAKLLVDSGLPVIEITLRTKIAFEAISSILTEIPEAILGVGTVLNSAQMNQAKSIGCHFQVSPGLTESLIEHDQHNGGDQFLPGVSTASEVMRAQELGYQALKLFPAHLVGGTKILKTFEALFPNIAFCPTGGIEEDTAFAYLNSGNVFAIGGSWIAPKTFVRNKNWAEISQRALRAKTIMEQAASCQ